MLGRKDGQLVGVLEAQRRSRTKKVVPPANHLEGESEGVGPPALARLRESFVEPSARLIQIAEESQRPPEM